MIGVIPAEEIPRIWGEIVPFVDRALEYNRDNVRALDVYSWLTNEQSSLLCEFKEYDEVPQIENICIIKVTPPVLLVEIFSGELFFSGDHREWDVCLDNICKETDCTKIRLFGRPGWVKRLKQYGYEHTYTIVEKKVESNGRQRQLRERRN